MKASEDNPHSIKYYVKKYILNHSTELKGKTVVDFPAGNGVTSRILTEVGAKPIPFDLFPQYFEIKDLECQKADVAKGIPQADASADYIVSQEGIEHFPNQLFTLQEFNRILKPGGTLLLTTPNYSNMRSRLSYFLAETERFNKILAPNELDSVWMAHDGEVYYGHIFLLGMQKLRTLARLAGFKIKKVHFNRIKFSSAVWCVLFYPFIFISNWLSYKKSLRKNKDHDPEIAKQTYREIFMLGISPKILVDTHLFVEFEKEKETNEVSGFLRGMYKNFSIKT